MQRSKLIAGFATLILAFVEVATLWTASARPAAAGMAAQPAEVYFEFDTISRPHTFVIKMVDPVQIQLARDILSGKNQIPHFPYGRIVKEPACYNIPWSFHLDPQSIVLGQVAITTCDGSIDYIQSNLDEVGKTILQDNFWCPIVAKLVREIPPPTCPAKTVVSVSAASYRRYGLATETIAAAFGENLATDTAAARTLPLPTQLVGTTVRVRDSQGIERLAPLFYVSPRQINYLIPKDTAFGFATITVTNGRGETVSGREAIRDEGPGLFAINGTGAGLAAGVILRVRGNQATYEPLIRYDDAQQKFVAVPIDFGPAADSVYLVLYGTGMRINRPIPGMRIPAVYTDRGVLELVQYVGPQGSLAGLDQVNVLLPREMAGRGDVPLFVQIDDKSSNPVIVNFK